LTREMASRGRLAAVMAATLVLVVIGVLNLRDRLSAPPVPYDGLEIESTAGGLRVKSVNSDSPLVYVVRRGDFIRFLFSRGKYEAVAQAETLDRYLDQQGVGNEARYVIEHKDPFLQGLYGASDDLYDVDFRVSARPQHLERGLYLAFIGLVYLTIGLFVLFKQEPSILTYHFFNWSLISFVVYFYSSTLSFTRLDRLVSFLDAAALALLAPVFLHFCANFPWRKGLFAGRRGLAVLLYVPAVAIIAVEAVWHYWPALFEGNVRLPARDLLNIAGYSQLVVFLVAGGVLLVRTYRHAQTSLLRKQLRWIIWGLGLAVVPLATFYLLVPLAGLDVRFFSGIRVEPWMETIACLPLILIPLSFGYSIVRYRLMDVDVIMRRSFVHVVAAIVLGAGFMAVLLGVSDLVKFIWANADLNSFKTKIIVVVGMLIVYRLFTPIKNKLTLWADRWFYGERYTLRTGLQDFGRTLAQTTALPQLLNSLVRRLSDMLSTGNVAIFIEDERSSSGFRLAHSSGMSTGVELPETIKSVIRVRSIGRGFIIRDDVIEAGRDELSHYAGLSDGEPAETGIDFHSRAAARLDDLHYFVPCVVRDRMVSIIGVGKTSSGAFLTSEDTELLRALSGYVAVAIDNSLLYRSETEKAEEMRRLREFSENIIETVSVGIVVVDLEGVITTWNSALEEIFGLTRDRVLQKNISTVFDEDLIETIRNVVGGESGWAIREPRHIYKYGATAEDGRPLTLNISLAPFEAARGVVTGTLVVLENVTERAQLEEQLLQREKLSSIGLLAAGVAHEVNTPLAGISSYAQMLLQQTSDEDPKRRLLEKIHVQTLRASGIVNNLLNFSRTGDAQLREVDVNRVLDDTLQLLEPQLRGTRIEIVRHDEENLPVGYGNPSKLQQVFMNLILNARDAMPEGGRLTIGARTVESSLVVDFRDTGIGIAPENIARIYDPFFTTKDVGLGTGLGLALSYGIIQEHGGRIFVESRPGEGAHFTIKLPTAYAKRMQVASD
jgi:two-component system, NtrC family, sensor kinase